MCKVLLVGIDEEYVIIMFFDVVIEDMVCEVGNFGYRNGVVNVIIKCGDLLIVSVVVIVICDIYVI